MIKLRMKLALFNLFSKLVFTLLFLILMPYLVERISLLQVDNELIQKREQVLTLISKIGIEPFMNSDNGSVFGSYNILKEEFISLERIELKEDANYIEVSQRLIEGEEITYRVLNYSFKVDGNTYLLEIGKSLSSILHTQKNIKKVMLLFLVFIILITFLTDLQYTGRLLRPLDIITNKLKGISNPSIFDKSPVRTTTSDFHHLDEALVELMSHIDQLFQKEKEISVNISHELMTPISVLRSKLENLLLQKNLDTGISTKIEESLKTLHRLQSLVNSILLIARIESRQYLREESFSIKDVPATTSFKDSITLGLVAGIYDYQPDTILLHHNIFYPFRLFKKTGTSNQMIVNLPQQLIFRPGRLHSFVKPDSVLVNDFTITASDYHLYYNYWNNLDYKLTAGLTLKSENLGSFDISESSNSFKDHSNSAQYTFPGGYTISTSWQTGDTSKMSFSFLQNSSTLLKETTLFMGTGFHKRERQYDLVIGNVEIKRGFGIDSIQVYQNGVLQKKAGARITDSSDSTGTIFNKRDILLTFDDGTTEKLSALIDPAITQLKTLFTSLHDMFFAENIVDYIAINIYYNSR